MQQSISLQMEIIEFQSGDEVLKNYTQCVMKNPKTEIDSIYNEFW